ncbi:hypothetical protein AVEN_126023-1, partial [Araneus ventricosus]
VRSFLGETSKLCTFLAVEHDLYLSRLVNILIGVLMTSAEDGDEILPIKGSDNSISVSMAHCKIPVISNGSSSGTTFPPESMSVGTPPEGSHDIK